MRQLLILQGPSAIGKSSIENKLDREYDINILTVYGLRGVRESDTHYKKIEDESELLIYFDKDGYKYGFNPSELMEDKFNFISVISNESLNKIARYSINNGIETKLIILSNTEEYIIEQLRDRGDVDIANRLTFTREDEICEYKSHIVIHKDKYDYRNDFRHIIKAIASLGIPYKEVLLPLDVRLVYQPNLYNDTFSFSVVLPDSILSILEEIDVARTSRLLFKSPSDNADEYRLSLTINDLAYIIEYDGLGMLASAIISIIDPLYIKYIDLLKSNFK